MTGRRALIACAIVIAGYAAFVITHADDLDAYLEELERDRIHRRPHG